jgi:predicted dehydrogenase
VTIEVALVGTGYIARFHVRAFQKQPDVEVVAVVDVQPDSMNEFATKFGILRQYSDLDALLRDGGIDAIVLGVPNHLHAPMTISALQAGVHVMVEKPMATNATEARKMLEVSQRTGASLFVAHCWRFDKEVLWLRGQVVSGRLGRIIRTKGYGVHVNWGPAGWFTQKRYGGGAMADMGIHAVDTARFLLGDPQPESVYARIDTCYGDFDVDDTGIIIVNWDNGATSYIESGWWQPHADGPEAATQLYGTDGFGQVFPSYLEIPDAETQTVERVESDFPPVREHHCTQNMYDNQAAYFVSCVRDGKEPQPGGLEGWINMKVVDAAQESYRTGRVVHLAGGS